MTWPLAAAEFLTSPRAADALAKLAESPGDTLATLESLRRAGHSNEEAGWLVAQADLRRKAAPRIPHAERLLFTPDAVSQATPAPVAAWRGARLAGRRVLEIGASVGGDTIALLQAGCEVVACERDPARAHLLAHNLAALGLSAEVRAGDALATDVSGVETLFADPARRIEGRRVLGLEEARPPLSALLELRARAQGCPLWVKAAPGLDVTEVPAAAALEFVSLGGELKEALLTFGEGQGEPLRRAVVLPAHEALDAGPAREAKIRPPGAFFFEPDPAVIRAGAVRALGARLEAWQLDERIAYLSGDTLLPTPFARCFRVLHHGLYRRKQVARWLREEGAGRVVVKQRGTKQDAAKLARTLPRTSGGPERWLFLARTDAGPLAILGAPASEA